MDTFSSNNDARLAFDPDEINVAKSSASDDSKKSFSIKETNAPTTPVQTSPKKSIKSTSINVNTNSMTTRYRFRDLLLGDFSFNDDGER